MKIYISGKMRGVPKEEYERQFRQAEMRLKARGHTVFNPCYLSTVYPWLADDDALNIDCAAVEICDAVYVLKGYEGSSGVETELNAAKLMKKEIIFESEVTNE